MADVLISYARFLEVRARRLDITAELLQPEGEAGSPRRQSRRSDLVCQVRRPGDQDGRSVPGKASAALSEIPAGVIDPVKVVRTALQNAASIASLMLTTEALVSELPEKTKGATARGRTARDV